MNLESTECLFCKPENVAKMHQAVQQGKSKELAALIGDSEHLTSQEVEQRLNTLVSTARDDLNNRLEESAQE